MNRILLSLLLLGMAGRPLPRATACSTILAGRQATADGSVLMSHSCDGDVMGKAAEAFLTAYASDCATNVGFAYSELVDYLMLRFLVGDPEFARPTLPRIAAPTVPDVDPLKERP